MATLGGENLTLLDISKRLNPDGKVDTVVELLSQQNELMEDMTWVEANDGSNNKTTVRTGLPQGTWRKLYKGIKAAKSSTAQVSDSTGILQAMANIDVLAVDHSSDPAGIRLSEEAPFRASLSNDIAQTFVYGDTAVNPERFHGFHQRFNILSDDDTLSGYNVLDAGGVVAARNTSIWLIAWHPMLTFGIYPEGSKAGIETEDFGRRLVPDAAGDEFPAYSNNYSWSAGLVVRDWRAVVRIANIDVALMKSGVGAADLVDQMIIASERIEVSVPGARLAWYMHKDVRTYLRLQKLAKPATQVEFATVEGKKIMTFDDIPVRRLDQLLLTEAVIA